MPERRVLIVGAGPVGLVAGTYLASAGIPVTIIEASADLPEDLRASTFHPPTLDMLDRFDITEKCIEMGLVCPQWQFRDRREGVVATFDLGMLEGQTRHPYRLQCEQWKLTGLLRDRMARAPDVEFIYDYRAVGISQDDAGVVLTIEAPDGQRRDLAGSYLIGADGARSAVRKAVGAVFDGMTIPEIYLTLSTAFRFDESMTDLANIAYVSDPEEWMVLLRTPTLWRVLLPTDPAEDEAHMTSPERVAERLQAILPNPAGYQVVHKTAYRVHERVADHYVFGRVFLAGDAAHVNNPLGGMGMNGGIHDAMNLAEKLVSVWNGAPLGLMGRYERQRRKVAVETVQAQALRNRRMLNETDPAARRAYHDELRAVVADPARHRDYMRKSSMLESLENLQDVA